MKSKHNCPLCGGSVYVNDHEDDYWGCINCNFEIPVNISLDGEDVIGLMTNPLYVELVGKLVNRVYTTEEPLFQLRQALSIIQNLKERIMNCDHKWEEDLVTLGTRSNTVYKGTEHEITKNYYVREQKRTCVKCNLKQVRESSDPRKELSNWYTIEPVEVKP